MEFGFNYTISPLILQDLVLLEVQYETRTQQSFFNAVELISGHFSGPDRAIGAVCVWTITFELNAEVIY